MEKFYVKDLQKGHTYLVSRNVFDVSQIYVVLVTDKAYLLRWKSGGESWELKENFENSYYLIEDISDFVTKTVKNTELVANTKWVGCYACNGTGVVPDTDTTAGVKQCPVCHGTQLVLEVLNIEKK